MIFPPYSDRMPHHCGGLVRTCGGGGRVRYGPPACRDGVIPETFLRLSSRLRLSRYQQEDMFFRKFPQLPPFVADGMVDILPGQDIVGDLGDDRADDLRAERQMGLFRMPARLLEPFGEEFRAGKIDG